MKIADIRSAVVSVPLTHPVGWATNTVSEREYILVWVLGEDGSFGLGYGLGGRFAGGAEMMHQFIQSQFRPQLVGAESLMVERIWDDLYKRTFLLGRRGLVLRALSVVDIALWDLNAKAVGLPLYRYLGGFTDTVKVYASGGYYSKAEPMKDLEAEIAAYQARGFTAVKIKVGGMPLAADVERVRLVRSMLGPEGLLALDANNAWSNVAAAQRAAERFAAFDPWWLEEPFSPDSAASFAELGKRTTIPLATGELEATRWPFRQMIDERSIQIVQADATVCGGITEWRRIAQMAAGFDLPVAPHWAPDVHAHLVAASPNGLAIEYFTPDRDIVNFDRLVETPLDLRNDEMHLSSRPGHGLSLVAERLRQHLRHDSSRGQAFPGETQ